MINVRQAIQTDAPKISVLLKQMGYEMSVNQVMNRIQEFNRDLHQLLVAEKEGEVVGCIGFGCYEALVVDGRCCHIDALIVDRNHRGEGIGKILISHAEEYATKKDCATIDLITSNRRRETGTHAFYRGLGYQDHVTRDYSYFSKESADLLCMRDRLEK